MQKALSYEEFLNEQEKNDSTMFSEDEKIDFFRCVDVGNTDCVKKYIERGIEFLVARLFSIANIVSLV